jgi:serine acetyltransferase
VYVVPSVVISRGFTIGDYNAIGANSFLKLDFTINCKAYGTPRSRQNECVKR